jgi:hypothetical protein
MKLLCQIVFWWMGVEIVEKLLMLAFYEYPRRMTVPPAADVIVLILCTIAAVFLFYAIWVRGTL